MSKKKQTKKELDKETKMYVTEQLHLIANYRQIQSKLDFNKFDGSYEDFLKLKRRYDNAIGIIKDNIKSAVKIAREEVIQVGDLW